MNIEIFKKILNFFKAYDEINFSRDLYKNYGLLLALDQIHAQLLEDLNSITEHGFKNENCFEYALGLIDAAKLVVSALEQSREGLI